MISKYALGLVDGIEDALRPFVTRMEIVGSLRRGVAEVGDIEFLVVPRLAPVQADLFGGDGEQESLLKIEVKRLTREDPEWSHREPRRCGPRYQSVRFRGFPVEIFSVLPPAQWGVLQIIRTGPAEFSQRVVTPRIQGGWLPAGCRVEGGVIYDAPNKRMVEAPDEESVFRFLGLDYIAPEDRR